MALEHIKTEIKFYDSHEDEHWEVVYRSRKGLTSAEVICDGDSFHYYNSIPELAIEIEENLNSAQALVIIRLAKKEKNND